jgi:Protein of unknown function (DUF1812).
MKIEYVRHCIGSVFLFILLPLLIAGCLKEDMSNCYTPVLIRVVAEAPQGADPINPQDVNHVALFIFDKNGNFIDKLTGQIGQIFELNYPGEENLSIVGLANITDTNEKVTQFSNGMPETDGKILLIEMQEYLAQAIYNSPSDIFWGEIDVVNDKSGITNVLPVKRIVASVNIKIRGLKELLQTNNEDFKVVVSTNFNAIDFDGHPEGSNTNYLPAGGKFQIQSPSQFDIPSFRILSSESGSPVVLKIYHNNQLIDVVTKDANGNPLLCYNGKLLEIRVNYIGNIEVSIINGQWGKETAWKDFN